MSIAANLANIRERIAAAAKRSGRSADAVTLVAVTKYVDAATAGQLLQAGCSDLGEARPQELWSKAAAIADSDIRWHLVGHLQTNKVRRTLPLVALIHSVDSVKLLEVINSEAGALEHRIPVLLEVNVSGDTAKHGFQPTDVAKVLDRISTWPQVQMRGLMCMAALDGGLDVARRNFATLRDLRDKLATHCPPTLSLTELSMGMSGDFEVAIEEGATIVRVGSALFD
jgi:pyridoxal phosphate enzyme (YggS family)